MVNAWESYLAENEERHFAELFDLLRIPSVSALPRHDADVRRAADWVATKLRQIGVPGVELVPTSRNPIVYAHWHVGDDQPTALIYGHYDVQPPDPLELWESPPFEPTLRDGRVYARGASDDKGNFFLTLAALEALVATNGKPPINVKFFVEGEEEIGSPSVPPVLAAEQARFACDFVISADGGMYGHDQPSLTVASKGIAACQLDVETARSDLHSGVYGAAAPNAVQALVQLAATLHSPDGRVAVAGFYDRVKDLTADERAEIAAVPFRESEFLDEIGARASWGEVGYSNLERRWARPTLDLNGIWGGFQGDGMKTVTPREAHAKITCRLVPDQDPAEIVELIARHVAAHCPPAARASVTRFPGGAYPAAIRRGHPALAPAKRVLQEMYGKQPLITRTGGTIPVAALFQRELGAEMVDFAWGMPDSQIHAPNESMRLEDLRRGMRGYCAYLTALAR